MPPDLWLEASREQSPRSGLTALGVDYPPGSRSPRLLLSRFSPVQLSATPWTRLLCPWDPPGQNPGRGCRALLWGSSPPRDGTCGSRGSCLAGFSELEPPGEALQFPGTTPTTGLPAWARRTVSGLPGAAAERGRSPEAPAGACGVQPLPAGQHHLQVQHVVAHGAVAHRVGARGSSGRHATERGVCTWVWRAEGSLVPAEGSHRASETPRPQRARQARGNAPAYPQGTRGRCPAGEC